MARSGVATLAVVLVVMMALVQGSMATTYTVGESTGWQMASYRDPNFYQEWVQSHKPFHSTDFLEFNWIFPDRVLQVDFASFNACNTHSPIQAWLANGDGEVTNMLFPLHDYSFRTLYFIGGDTRNCAFGQKFFIDVIE